VVLRICILPDQHRFVNHRKTALQLARAVFLPPNGLVLSRAALIDRDMVRAHLDAKMAVILSSHCGVD